MRQFKLVVIFLLVGCLPRFAYGVQQTDGGNISFLDYDGQKRNAQLTYNCFEGDCKTPFFKYGGGIKVERNKPPLCKLEQAWDRIVDHVNAVKLHDAYEDIAIYASDGGATVDFKNYFLFNPEKCTVVGMSLQEGHRNAGRWAEVTGNFTDPRLFPERTFLLKIKNEDTVFSTVPINVRVNDKAYFSDWNGKWIGRD